VQVGAFTRKVNPESSFFKGETFDFEKQINNFYKYFIGRFSSLDKAIEERKRLEKKFRGAFVVGIKNGRVIDINER
jgi:N-acetylmuramoyl-L-alanine amidase